MTDAHPRFAMGQRVIDRERQEEPLMVVIDPNRGRADRVTVDERDATVAELNPAYPADDRVVECVHREWLEHHVGARWQQWDRPAFRNRLYEFAGEWRLRPRTYDYPESRLALHPSEEPIRPEPSRSREPERPQQTSIEDWR